MFSKDLVKLTGVYLFYISSTSATPITGQPEEAHKVNDDIHARTYNPYLCQPPYIWLRRECVASSSPMAWQDVCTWYTYDLEYDNKPGSCPVGTTCLDGYNSEGNPFISCISNDKSTGKRKVDPQWGMSATQKGRTEVGNSQQQYSVTIDHDMDQASVAAVLESESRTVNTHCRIFFTQLNLGDDGSFLIAPNNVIVGNVHGYRENVCHGDKSNPAKSRECYPNGKYDFKSGQTIDFTWGMTADQLGKIVYGVVPAQSL